MTYAAVRSRAAATRLMYPVLASDVLPMVERWLAGRAADYARDDAFGQGTLRLPPLVQLAERAGLKRDACERLVRRIRNEGGRGRRLSIATADRLITATAGPAGWYETPELQAVYEGLREGRVLRPAEVRKWAEGTLARMSDAEIATFTGAVDSLLESVRGGGEGRSRASVSTRQRSRVRPTRSFTTER